MPKNNKQRSSKRNSSDRQFVASHHAAASGDVLFPPEDITRVPISNVIRQKPPKNLQSKITWIETSYFTSLTIPAAGGGILETNQVFNLASIALVSSWQALFDQYCIYSALVRFTLGVTESTGNPVQSKGSIVTAIDFDSGTAVGSASALLGFNSAISSDLVPGKSYERFCKPCVTIAASSGSSSATTGNLVGRSWVDSAFNAVPHFGIRCICSGNLSTNSEVLVINTTLVIGFRNNY